MANHVIRDRIWASRKLGKCSLQAALAYPWIFLVCDDWGRFEFEPQMIWKQVFPRRDDVSYADVEGWLGEYETVGLLRRYHLDGDLAFWTGFDGREIKKRRPSMYPDPKDFQVESVRTQDQLVRTETVRSKDTEVRTSESVRTFALPAERSGAEQILAETETERSTTAPPVSPSNGNGLLPVPEDQRQEYADAVWSEFLKASGQRGTRLMSPQEFSTLRGWMDAGIPLHAVLRGIADTKGKGRMLGYYNSSVLEAYERTRAAMKL